MEDNCTVQYRKCSERIVIIIRFLDSLFDEKGTDVRTYDCGVGPKTHPIVKIQKVLFHHPSVGTGQSGKPLCSQRPAVSSIEQRIGPCLAAIIKLDRHNITPKATTMKFSLIFFVAAIASASAFVPQSSFGVGARTQDVVTTTALFGEVTPKTIKALRDATGAGMMDCKKALLEADGDQEAAAEALRAKGLAKADKKASRVAAEGKIAFATAADKAVMVEVNCETDFVAKDSEFLKFCDNVASKAIDMDSDDVEALMKAEVDGETLEDSRSALVAKIGENIQVRRLASRGGKESSTVGCYVHMNRIGVLVELEGGDESLCTDIAMHVAAMNPPYATPEQVPQDVLEKEKDFLTQQALDSGKPKEIVEKMVEGRIRKYLEEICLVSQTYVKDGDKTVGKLCDDAGAKMVGFTRIEVGEGIEKKEDDFAAEVASMAAGKA